MDLIAGRFRVDRWLGEGNLGQLYVVEQVETPFRNTLRVLPAGTSGGAGPRTPLTEFVTRIQHQNLARVDEVGQTPDGLTYVVMDHSSGTLLTEVVGRGGVPLRWAVEIVRQMIAGIRAAHESGTIHGALTPGSVMIGSSEDDRLNVRILDLGLFTLFREVGCRPDPRYASVEVLTGRVADELSDVFSLGAVAYHLLTGTPFGTPSQEPNQIPPALSAVLRTALAKEPVDRFVSVARLGHALEQAWPADAVAWSTATTTPAATPAPVVRATPPATTPTAKAVAPKEPLTTTESARAAARTRTFESASTRPQTAAMRQPPTESASPVSAAPKEPGRGQGRRKYELAALATAAVVLLTVWLYRPATRSADLAMPKRPLVVAPEVSAPKTQRAKKPSSSRVLASKKPARRRITTPTILPGQGYKESLSRDADVRPDTWVATAAPIPIPAPTASGVQASSEAATASGAPIPIETATVAESPPAVTVTSVSEATMAEARAAAASAVSSYASAIEAKDLEAISRVDPGLTEQQRSAWQEFFAANHDVKAQLTVDDVSLIAQATVSGVLLFANPRVDSVERTPVSFRATLTRAPDGWHLTQVR